MNKIDLKKESKKVIHAIKRIGSDPDKDWKLFFLLFVIALVASIIGHLNIFLQVEGVKESGATLAPKQGELIDSRALSSLLSSYDKRALDYAAIASSTPLVDPAR
ncbi:MAG: hypothetical protein V4438_03145 [Patescibacteria group bacterium]